MAVHRLRTLPEIVPTKSTELQPILGPTCWQFSNKDRSKNKVAGHLGHAFPLGRTHGLATAGGGGAGRAAGGATVRAATGGGGADRTTGGGAERTTGGGAERTTGGGA